MEHSKTFIRVGFPTRLRRTFDYIVDNEKEIGLPPIGARVRVPFGRRQCVGVVTAHATTSEVPADKLKTIDSVLDDTPILSPTLLKLCQWASDYYHFPLGDVCFAALPSLLRKGQSIEGIYNTHVACTAGTFDFGRAPKQQALYDFLTAHPEGLPLTQVQAAGHARASIHALEKKGAVTFTQVAPHIPAPNISPPTKNLKAAQSDAVSAITEKLDTFHPFLLEGVTGSGKTEVYLHIIARVLEAGKQALVLVPEISLTPQTLERFEARFGQTVSTYHSNMTEKEKLRTWCLAREGHAQLIIGTRSAIFLPLKNPGLIILDESHDASFKQHEGFRYSAKTLAMVRGKLDNIPVGLGSATPSLESIHLAKCGRYQHLFMPERAGAALPPTIKIIDVRKTAMEDGISPYLKERIDYHLKAGGQILLFLNRRGYAPTLLCHHCGWVAQCHRCDANMTLHYGPKRVVCHHCDHTAAIGKLCPHCHSDKLVVLGTGTERLETALSTHYGAYGIVRIDRDSTARKGALASKLADIHSQKAQIMIGTQMVAKGHHFPNLTLAVIVGVDEALFSADFRSEERIAQLITQVAGRAGRGDKAGEVILQTHHPEHPLLQTLVKEGYHAYANQALAVRERAGLPPHGYLALVKTDSPEQAMNLDFLREVKTMSQQLGGTVKTLGPITAPMERRAGHYHAQLLIRADSRGQVQQRLSQLIPCLENLPLSKKVRWDVDVDPLEMY